MARRQEVRTKICDITPGYAHADSLSFATQVYCGKRLQFVFSRSSGLLSLYAAIKWIVCLSSLPVIRSVELHSRRVCMRI